METGRKHLSLTTSKRQSMPNMMRCFSLETKSCFNQPHAKSVFHSIPQRYLRDEEVVIFLDEWSFILPAITTTVEKVVEPCARRTILNEFRSIQISATLPPHFSTKQFTHLECLLGSSSPSFWGPIVMGHKRLLTSRILGKQSIHSPLRLHSEFIMVIGRYMTISKMVLHPYRAWTVFAQRISS